MRDELPDFFVTSFADAADQHDVFGTPKCSASRAVFDDRLGRLSADARQSFELWDRRRVDIHGITRSRCLLRVVNDPRGAGR